MGIIGQSKKVYTLVKSLKELKSAQDGPESERAQEYLNQILKSDGGIFEKVLQYMGTQNKHVEELVYKPKAGLAATLVQEIWDLQFPNSGIVIKEESYAASIGQVNLAQKDGEEFAVKIRYPNIEKKIKDQLKLVNLLPKLQGVSPTKKWGFDFGIYQRTIQAVLDQELNLENEATALLKWEGLLKGTTGISVPRVNTDFISKGAYLQQFVRGLSVREISDLANPVEKKKWAENLVHGTLELFFNHGLMQGDSNFGNFLFSKPEQKVYFIDLGQEIHFDSKFVNAIACALDAKYRGEAFSILGLFQDLGFNTQKLKPLHQKLPLLTEILLEPFVCNRVYNLNQWNYKKEIDLLLGEDKWWFRSAGGSDFFLFMKAFMGLKNILNYWNTGVNWTQLIRQSLVNKQWQALTKIAVEQEYLGDYKGRNIMIRVTDAGKEKVKLTLPFMTLFDLDDYIDDDVQVQIEAQGISVKEVVRDALADGGQPKILFELDKEQKHYHIAIV